MAIQQIYDYCWNHFGKTGSLKTSRIASQSILRPEKTKNRISVLQAYYKLHYPKHKDAIASRWETLRKSDKSGSVESQLVGYRNQWMQEFLDQESADVKAAVAEFRDTYNNQLKHEESSNINWSIVDSATTSSVTQLKDSVDQEPKPPSSNAIAIDDNIQPSNPAKDESDDRTEKLVARQR